MKKVNSQSINAQSLMSKKVLAISPKEYKLETYSVGVLHQTSCVGAGEAELEYSSNMRIEKPISTANCIFARVSSWL